MNKARFDGRGIGGDNERPITVLLVEDHLILAESFAALLNRDPLIQVVGIASTANEAVILARRHEPDVVLMDVRLPDGSGVDAALKIRSTTKGTAFIFLTAYDSVEALGQAVEAGAAAFLPKSEASDTVVEAIKKVAAGEMLIEPGKIQHALAWHRARRHQERERQAAVAALTRREMEVLSLLAEGETTVIISARLHISALTVKTHIRSVLAKLDAHSQLQAVARAQTLGILPTAAIGSHDPEVRS
ncbi:MAG: response regulator transcription factor [Candidatus Dormibacteraceae bacterium]